ncbi:MAG: hypothetical protein ACLP9L_04800 [Thermoguttaceae bacterium]
MNIVCGEPLFRAAGRSEGPLARFVRQAVEQYKRKSPGHGQKSLWDEPPVQTRQHKIEWDESEHPREDNGEFAVKGPAPSHQPQPGRMTEPSTVREQLRAAKAIREAKWAEEDASNAAQPGDRQRAKAENKRMLPTAEEIAEAEHWVTENAAEQKKILIQQLIREVEQRGKRKVSKKEFDKAKAALEKERNAELDKARQDELTAKIKRISAATAAVTGVAGGAVRAEKFSRRLSEQLSERYSRLTSDRAAEKYSEGFDPEKHPRGQPENAGEFAQKGQADETGPEEGDSAKNAEHRKFLEGPPVISLKGDEVPHFAKLAELVDWAANWFATVHNGKAVSPAIGEVQLDKRAARDSFSHHRSDAKQAALVAVPAIIAHGKLIHEGPSRKNARIYGYFLAAPIRIANESYVGVALVQKDANKQRLYVHEVRAIKSLQGSATTGAFDESKGLAGTEPGDIESLLRRIFTVKTRPQGDKEKYALVKEKIQAPPSQGAPATPGKQPSAEPESVQTVPRPIMGSKAVPETRRPTPKPAEEQAPPLQHTGGSSAPSISPETRAKEEPAGIPRNIAEDVAKPAAGSKQDPAYKQPASRAGAANEAAEPSSDSIGLENREVKSRTEKEQYSRQTLAERLTRQILERYSRQAALFVNPSAPAKAWREELHPRDHGKFTDKSARRMQPDMGATPKIAPTQGQKSLFGGETTPAAAKKLEQAPALPQAKQRQETLFHGLNDAPGQQDLFDLDKGSAAPPASPGSLAEAMSAQIAAHLAKNPATTGVYRQSYARVLAGQLIEKYSKGHDVSQEARAADGTWTDGPGAAGGKKAKKIDRTTWGKQHDRCWLCGKRGSETVPLQTHEIARGPARQAAMKEPAAWLRLCNDCHAGRMPDIATQLALKRRYDDEHYDRVAVNLLRSRQPEAISEADVDKAEKKLPTYDPFALQPYSRCLAGQLVEHYSRIKSAPGQKSLGAP